MTEDINKIRKLFIQQDHEEAFKQINFILESGRGAELRNQFLQTQIRYERIKKARIENQLSFDEASRESSKLDMAILALLDKLEKGSEGQESRDFSHMERVSFGELKGLSREKLLTYIQHFKNDITNGNTSSETYYCIGLVNLHLGLYDLAQNNLSKAIEIDPDEGRSYYFLALAKLQRRRPSNLIMPELKEIEQLVLAGISLSPSKAVFYCFLAYLKYEYYLMNGMSDGKPGVNELVNSGKSKSIDSTEIERLEEIQGIHNHIIVNYFKG
ncbi:MAG: tetratricopeptide repeat protein [Bacteroidia bacterium]|nr:tetratricopeptide repeat protein [Bacteroidia bacterium]